MTLRDRLPDRVQVGRRAYRADFDFRNVLKMLDILSRDDLMDEAREYLALKCVMRRVPRRCAEALAAVRALLFPPGGASSGRRMTDFEQDADYIRAAFLQCYGINLWRDRLHWLEFTALLAGLPEGNRYTEIVEIRARPLPKPTKYNREEREWLIRAKSRYALVVSDREAERNYEAGVKSIFAGLLSMAEKEVTKDA